MGKSVGNLYVSLGLNTTPFTKGMHDAQDKLRRFKVASSSGKNAFGGLSGSINTANSALSRFSGLLAVGGIAAGVKTLIDISDKYTELDGRLRLVTKSTQEFQAAQSGLYKIALETRVAYADTADLYTRFARSTEELGLSQSDLLTITESINKALIVSGASGESANAALVQLGQGMASGTLRGEELNSILEQTPRLARMIAEGMGITIGQLREYGKEGKLTAEAVATALQSQASAIDSEFARMEVTVSQAMTNLTTVFESIVTEANKAEGGTNSLAGAITDLATTIDENRDTIINSVELISTAFSGMGSVGGKAIKSIGDLSISLVKIIDKGLGIDVPESLSVMGDGWQAASGIIAGAVEVIETTLDGLVQATKHTGNAFITLNDIIAKSLTLGAFGTVEDALSAGAQRALDIHEEFIKKAEENRQEFLEALKKIHADQAAGAGAPPGVIGGESGGESSGAASGGQKKSGGSSEFQSLFDRLMPIEAEERRYKESLKVISEYYGERAEMTEEDDLLRLKLAEEHQKKIDEINGVPAMERKLEQMQDQYKTERELEIERYDEQINDLSDFRENELVTQEEYNDLLQKTEKEHQDKLTEIEKAGLTDRERFEAMSLKNKAKKIFSELAEVTAGVAQHNKTLFAINKAAGIANAVINTYEGVSKTLATYPWPIAQAMAAVHLAAGIAQVAAIASTSFSGSGTGSAPSLSGSAPSLSGSTSAPAVSDVSASSRSITIYGIDKNSLYSGDQIEAIANGLSEYVADGGKIYIK